MNRRRSTLATAALAILSAGGGAGAAARSAPTSIAETPAPPTTAGDADASPTGSSIGPGSSAPGATAPPILLPEPTGVSATGTAMAPIERAGPDPLDPTRPTRDLVVQFWYPTDDPDGARAPYAPAGEAEALQSFYPVPPGAFLAETNSTRDAAVQPGRHTVVFFGHGLCASRTDSTILAEELASHGYIVAAFGSTGESAAVELADGSVVGPVDPAFCAAGADPFSPDGQAVLTRLLDVRVTDVRAVADILEDAAEGDATAADMLPPGLAAAIEPGGFGIYGHSFGGGTAAAVLSVDDRFVAGIDLDGFIIGPVATAGLDDPFLVIGSSYHDPLSDPSWASFLPNLRGWRAWWTLADAGHYRFIDLGGSAHRWGLDQTLRSQDPTTWGQVFGDVDDAQSQAALRAAVVGFFDVFLRAADDDRLAEVLSDHPVLVDRTAEIPPAD